MRRLSTYEASWANVRRRFLAHAAAVGKDHLAYPRTGPAHGEGTHLQRTIEAACVTKARVRNVVGDRPIAADRDASGSCMFARDGRAADARRVDDDRPAGLPRQCTGGAVAAARADVDAAASADRLAARAVEPVQQCVGAIVDLLLVDPAAKPRHCHGERGPGDRQRDRQFHQREATVEGFHAPILANGGAKTASATWPRPLALLHPPPPRQAA